MRGAWWDTNEWSPLSSSLRVEASPGYVRLGGVVTTLTEAGHDVIWAGEWPEDPGDAEILARAHRDGRVLVTLDKDFGELALVRNQPHSGILRLVDFRSGQQAVACLRVLDLYEDDLSAGSIMTAEPGRVRIRAPEREN